MNPSAGPRTHRRTYPNINVPVHFDAFLPAKHQDLPVDLTAHPHTHRCNRLSSYLFILKLSFRLTTNTYLSTHLQYYISTVPPPLHAPPSTPPPPHFSLTRFINLQAQLNIFLQAKNARLPVSSYAGLRTHRSTRK